MEACFANLVEPGDDVVIGVAGVFGERMCEVAARIGARVTRVETEPGTRARARRDGRRRSRACGPRVVAFVHAETSTGVLQPVEEIAAAAREAGALVVLDCVTSLGGAPGRARRLGRRRRLQRHAEVSVVPARPLAGELRRARAASGCAGAPRRCRAGTSMSSLLAGYFGARARLPPHRADLGDLRARRGAAHRRGRGHARRAPRATAAPPRALLDGLAAARLRAARRPSAVRLPHAHRAAAARARRRGRRGGAAAPRCSSATASRSAAGSASSRAAIWRIGLMGENARTSLRRAPARGAARRAPRLTFLPRSC